MPSGEIQTDSIVRHALASGKQVFVPYLHKPQVEIPGAPARIMDMVRLKDIADYESLDRDRWGIPSINPATVESRQRILGDQDATAIDGQFLDMILLPGVAFDLGGQGGTVQRLGHGKGFYDFFIHRYGLKTSAAHARAAPVLLYGLALTEQFLPTPAELSVPAGPQDKGLDGLIVGNGGVKQSPSSLHR
jgi:5-formyltetrahydrofolate cyclo-ligase